MYNKLKFENCDSYLILSEVNRFYFSGFKSSFGAFVIGKENKFYLTDSRYIEACEAFFANKDVEVVLCQKDNYKIKLSECLSFFGKVVGIEGNDISYNEINTMKREQNIDVVDVSNEIIRLRSIKTIDEISLIRTACEISDKAYSKILPLIKSGVSERDLSIELKYQLFKNGATDLAFEPIIASGENSAKPHAEVSMRKLEKGDFLVMDFGAKFKGYCSDITRTVVVDEASEDQEELYNYVLKAQLNALKAVKPGMTGHEADSLVREFFNSNNLGHLFVHGLGHGVGLDIHESPTVSRISDCVLEENMVITIEPGLYIPNKYGVRIEDTALMTKDGLKPLTLSNK